METREQIINDLLSAPVVMKQGTVNEKTISFPETASFEIQVGKGKKGSYKTIGTYLSSNLDRAYNQYQNLNIEAGFKKRLACFAITDDPIIASSGVIE